MKASRMLKLIPKLRKIKLVVCDIDGVLTDGSLYYDGNGLALKKFNVKDGMAVWLLRRAGIETAIVSTDVSPVILARAKRLEIQHCYIGEEDKKRKVKAICEEMNISLEEVAFIGDDVNDIEVIKSVGFGACPVDAVLEVKVAADYVCKTEGGRGVLREITEMLLAFNPNDE